MKLAMSNIAWPVEVDDAMMAEIRDGGVAGLEIAPPRWWPDLSAADSTDVEAKRADVERAGLTVVAAQSLLYGRPDLELFADAATRAECIDYLLGVVRLCGRLRAPVLVFGSPKNRLRRGKNDDDVSRIATEIFTTLGDQAVESGVIVGIEANPTQYAADVWTDAKAAAAFVRTLDHPGIRLHLCAGCMRLAGDPIDDVVYENADLLAHVHISEPFLNPIDAHGSHHEKLAKALRRIVYPGWISIEMRTPEPFDRRVLADSVAAARRVYLDDN